MERDLVAEPTGSSLVEALPELLGARVAVGDRLALALLEADREPEALESLLCESVPPPEKLLVLLWLWLAVWVAEGGPLGMPLLQAVAVRLAEAVGVRVATAPTASSALPLPAYSTPLAAGTAEVL